MTFQRIGESRVVKHMLSNWLYYEQNISELPEESLRNFKLLYTALSQLSPEERLFLAEKYHTDKSKRLNDQQLADKRGLTIKEYRQQRIAIEKKIAPYLLEQTEANIQLMMG